MEEELPFYRVFKDGPLERLVGAPIVPPLPENLETEVSLKDITISQDPPISARVYPPKVNELDQKLPVLVYLL